jgi:glycosyltransferase involved in cell wall biosynthesis
MQIAIDISMLVYQGSGVANYTYNFVKALLKYDKKNKYKLFYSSLRKPTNFYYLEQLKKLGAKVSHYPFPPRLLNLIWNKWQILPVEWLIGKVDIYHSSDFLRPPLLTGTRGITTIHDLTWKIFPEFHTPEIVAGHERKLQKTIKHQDLIITDSHNTKKDLLKYYPQVKKENITVIPLGIGERFKKIKDEQVWPVLKKYQLKKRNYLLYVGAIEPRKNLDTCIKIFSELIKDKEYADFQFLIVGRAGWKNQEIFSLIKNMKLEHKIKFVGFVQDDDLPHFYNAAKLTLYLSKYEGYGLPPLESLACGTPALALKNSSLTEILPNDYLSDDNFKAILDKTKRLLSTNNTKLVKIPSWQAYVQQFLSCIPAS